MKTQILVDTDILIDVARRNDDAIQRLIIEG
jgi:predicted nucleic acid-binding protein